MRVAAIGPSRVAPTWRALRIGLPTWVNRAASSRMMLIPFRQRDGRLDLLLLGMDGSQAVLQAGPPDGERRFVFAPIGVRGPECITGKNCRA